VSMHSRSQPTHRTKSSDNHAAPSGRLPVRGVGWRKPTLNKKIWLPEEPNLFCVCDKASYQPRWRHTRCISQCFTPQRLRKQTRSQKQFCRQ
jgi:hypothetical protein